MAAIPITLVGMATDENGTKNVTFVGMASLTGLGVGGGPIEPGPGNPPGIWGGGNVPMPTPPIANVPGAPGYRPPGIWGGPIDPYPGHPLPEPPGKPVVPPPSIWPPGPGIDFPAHPIVIPPPVDPGDPGIPPGSLITWKPIWTPDSGWQVIGFPNVPHPAPA